MAKIRIPGFTLEQLIVRAKQAEEGGFSGTWEDFLLSLAEHEPDSIIEPESEAEAKYLNLRRAVLAYHDAMAVITCDGSATPGQRADGDTEIEGKSLDELWVEMISLASPGWEFFAAGPPMKVNRGVHLAASTEAMRLGLKLKITKGGKHPKLVVSDGKSHRKSPMSGSPRSDCENQKDWVRQQVRRMARDMGASQ